MKKLSLFCMFSMLAFGQQSQPIQLASPENPNASNSAANCLKGARNALAATVIVTGVGCAIDLFLSGGALCLTYLYTAAYQAPVAAASGCAAASIGQSAPGLSQGLSAAPDILQIHH